MTDTTTEGWTPWDGGECPVARGLTVEVELRDGSKAIQVAGDWYWPHYGSTHIAGSGDIIAYRIVSPAVPDPVAAAVEAEREAADAKLIAAVDRWICLYQPMIATAAKHKRTQAEEREARNVIAFAAAEWAATHRDPRAIVEAARARPQGEQK